MWVDIVNELMDDFTQGLGIMGKERLGLELRHLGLELASHKVGCALERQETLHQGHPCSLTASAHNADVFGECVERRLHAFNRVAHCDDLRRKRVMGDCVVAHVRGELVKHGVVSSCEQA